MLNPEIPHSVFVKWEAPKIIPFNSENRYSFEVHAIYSEITQGQKYISQAGFIISSNKKEEIINSLMSFTEIEKEKRILEYALRSMFKINKLSGEYAALMEESIPDEKYELLMQSY